jgi:hypothetical protein
VTHNCQRREFLLRKKEDTETQMGKTKYLESFVLGGETVRLGEFVLLYNGIVGEVTCIWEHNRKSRCELKLLYPPDHTVGGALPWNGKAELLPSLEVTEAEPPQLDKKVCIPHNHFIVET